MASAADIGIVPRPVAPSGSASSVRLNPIPHETAVLATGARPAEGSQKRELFSENTTTVLVFERGAVIRLAADIAPGQLIFLTHLGTKREVVAQVTKKRNFQAAGDPHSNSYYVELEFTEPAPGFWGVEFPAAPVASAPNTPARAAEELVRFESVGHQEASVPPADAEEVAFLKEEVEALREQLKALQSTRPADDSNARASSAPAAPASVEPAKNLASENLPAAAGNAVDAEQALDAPHDSAAAEAAHNRALDALAEEARSSSAESEGHSSEGSDAELPKPALDFGKAGKARGKPRAVAQTKSDAKSSGGLRAALLAALLLVAIGGAWFEGWIPGIPAPQKPSSTAAAPAPAPRVPGRPVGAKTFGGPGAKGVATSSAAAANAPQPGNGANDNSSPSNAAARADAAEKTSGDASKRGSDAADSAEEHEANPPAPHASSAKTEVKKSLSRTSNEEVDAAPVQGAANSAPKLIKTVRAVPPAAAVRSFITGNVEVEAVVDATGRVKSAKAVSGPEILHKAALEAVKEYRYEPARRNGKAVSAPVSITVQFWYEP